MRPLGQALSLTVVLRRGNLDTQRRSRGIADTEERPGKHTGEGDHLQAREREDSEETHPSNTLILDY